DHQVAALHVAMDEADGERVEGLGEPIKVGVEGGAILILERSAQRLKAVLTKMIELPAEQRSIHPALHHDRAFGRRLEALMELSHERDGLLVARDEARLIRALHPIFEAQIAEIFEEEHARLEIDRVDLRDVDGGALEETRDLTEGQH